MHTDPAAPLFLGPVAGCIRCLQGLADIHRRIDLDQSDTGTHIKHLAFQDEAVLFNFRTDGLGNPQSLL